MISVIVPVYNGEKYIENCVHMLMNQDYGNFEAIFINDGSTDKTVDLFYQLTKNDKRFHLISIENHGVSYARNLGMKYVKGDFFTFIDCDDYIENNYLQNLLLCMSDEIDAVYCKVDVVNSQFNILKSQFLLDKIYTSEELLIELLSFNDLNTGPCAKLYKSKLLNENISFTNLDYYEDLVFNIDVLGSIENVLFTSSVSYKYIHRENEGAMEKYVEAPSLDVIEAMRYAIEKIKNNNQYDSLFYCILSQVMMYGIKCNKNNDKLFIKETKKFLRDYFIDLLKNKSINKNEKIIYIIYSISYRLFCFVRKE